MLPTRFPRRTTCRRNRSSVVLPQPLVGDVAANLGEIVNLPTAQVCIAHNAIMSAVVSGITT